MCLAGGMVNFLGEDEVQRLINDVNKFVVSGSSSRLHTVGVLSTSDGHDADDTKQSTADMTIFVQNLLQQMQSRFQTMSDNIITKIDEMGNRIDELEQSINDLRAEMGQEGTPTPSTTLKSKEETRAADDAA